MIGIRLPRLARPGFASLALAALLAGCGGGSSSKTSDSPAGKSFAGTLADGSALALTFGAAAAVASPVQAGQALVLADATGTITITGTITYVGSDPVAVTGTFDLDTKTFTITGDGYSLTGTYASGTITGTGTAPSGEVSFIAMDVAAAVTRYCGSYTGSEDGNMMLIVSGSKALLTVSSGGGKAFSGTVSGNTVTITGSTSGGSVSVHGTIDPSTGIVTGTWSGGGGTGTWLATVDQCSV